MNNVDFGLSTLKKGHLLIVQDDFNEETSFLIGSAIHVKDHHINTMTKIGKGLTYVGMTESRAKSLRLSSLVDETEQLQRRNFTVSVDYTASTTGISASERAETIRQLASSNARPQLFNRPGHVFPLIGREFGILERLDMVEASLDLVGAYTNEPVTYLCEILNAKGEVATIQEVADIAEKNQIPQIKLSDIISWRSQDYLFTFEASVIEGEKQGSKLGVPSMNLKIDDEPETMRGGVYGIEVVIENAAYFGIMNVQNETERPHRKIHLFHYEGSVPEQKLEVRSCFFMRPEVTFETIQQILAQVQKDKELAQKRFSLHEKLQMTSSDH